MNFIKRNNGITLVSLAITIIVLVIIAGITIYYSNSSIRNANLQNFKTDMLLIEAKTKEYVENASYELGVNPEQATEEMKAKANSHLKGTMVTSEDTSLVNKLTGTIGISQEDINNGLIYKLSTQDLVDMGINNVESDEKNGYYIVKYDKTNANVTIYSSVGFRLESGTVKYCLDDIRDIDTVE